MYASLTEPVVNTVMHVDPTSVASKITSGGNRYLANDAGSAALEPLSEHARCWVPNPSTQQCHRTPEPLAAQRRGTIFERIATCSQ